MDAEQDQSLIGQIYDTVEDLGRLRDVIRVIRTKLHAVEGQYLELGPTNDVEFTLVTSPAYREADALYVQHYYRVDPRYEWFTTGKLGEWRADHDRFTDRFRDRDEFYNDYLARYEFDHTLTGCLGLGQGRRELLALLRPREVGKFTDEERDFVRQLSPHFARASALRNRMNQMRIQLSVQEAELAHTPLGLIWICADGTVATMNEKAKALLSPEIGLQIRGDRLHAWVASDAQRLDSASRLATAAINRRGALLAIRRKDRIQPLVVSVVPVALPPMLEHTRQGPFALVILQDADAAAQANVAHLRTTFGLTASEADLARALAMGSTIDQYAATTNVARSTVRTHLTHLFEKTATSRQVELVRLVVLSMPWGA